MGNALKHSQTASCLVLYVGGGKMETAYVTGMAFHGDILLGLCRIFGGCKRGL